VEANLIQPHLCAGLTRWRSPTARAHPQQAGLVERFEPVHRRRAKTANAFSELIDPLDQAAAAGGQQEAPVRRRLEAQGVDEDFSQPFGGAVASPAGWVSASTGWPCCSRQPQHPVM